jgi:hypothetical protein
VRAKAQCQRATAPYVAAGPDMDHFPDLGKMVGPMVARHVAGPVAEEIRNVFQSNSLNEAALIRKR